MTDTSTIISYLLSWEGLAVVLAIAYLVLAARENIWCWYCALVSTVIYTMLFWNVQLLMESALNVYYIGMAVYGWHQWRYGGRRHHGITIHSWRLKQHLLALVGVLLLSGISGVLLERYTQAAYPWLDSFTTWASILTTWMVTRKVLENWLYWFVIDAVSIWLYMQRELYLTALLFAAYLIIVLVGYYLWRRQLHENESLACTIKT